MAGGKTTPVVCVVNSKSQLCQNATFGFLSNALDPEVLRYTLELCASSFVSFCIKASGERINSVKRKCTACQNLCYVLDCSSSVTAEVLSATLEVKELNTHLVMYTAVWRTRHCILWKGLCQKTRATHQNFPHAEDPRTFFCIRGFFDNS